MKICTRLGAWERVDTAVDVIRGAKVRVRSSVRKAPAKVSTKDTKMRGNEYANLYGVDSRRVVRE